MIKHNFKQSGFTLIETFVAIVVLTIAVLGPMTLLSRALQDSRYIKDQITATFLAQEGVELLIHNKNKGGSDLVLGEKGAPYSCALKLDQIIGYNCTTGNNTNFERIVIINQDGGLPTNQFRIISAVTFIKGGVRTKPIISKTILTK